jgi:tRNA pseudouridine38-40 synthase
VRHIRLVVEYDGTDLCGWQRQANGPTVQGHLEAALGKLLAHEVAVAGASRTDSGVHAYGQVASFRTERAIPLHGIRRGLNSLLPEAIAIVEASEAPVEFHPRFSATGKHYRYLLFTRAERSPHWRRRAWHRAGPLDLTAMRGAAAALLGEHDFAAFRAAGCTAKTTLRRIDQIEVTELFGGGGERSGGSAGASGGERSGGSAGANGGERSGGSAGSNPRGFTDEPGLVAIDVRGNAFLRNMVRILVGTLVEVGEGRRPPAQVAEILASKDRTRAGITAPAHGLALISVSYDGRKILPPRGVE